MTEPLITRGSIIWIGLFLLVLVRSAIQPFDRFIWWLEVSPALIAAVILLLTRSRFPLTPLTYGLILLHCIILLVGGHYTYAEVPLFDWLAEVFNWQRNNYDKVGHFAQGFVPAIVARIAVMIQVTSTTRSGSTPDSRARSSLSE